MENETTCSTSGHFQDASNAAFFITYYMIGSIYLLIGLPGQLLALAAYRKQYKLQRAYMYQVFCAANDTAFLISQVLYVFGHEICSGIDEDHPGCLWYRQSHLFMLYDTYLSVTLPNTFFTISILLALATTIDRVIALMKPFLHKTLKHSRHQLIALASCILIGVLVNASDVLLQEITPSKDDMYSVVINEAYDSSVLSKVTWYSRNVVLGVGVFGLAAGNWLLIHLYRKRNYKNVQLTQNSDKDAEMKARERTLLSVTVSQAFLKFCAASVVVAYYTVSTYAMSYLVCIDPLVSPLCDAVIMVTGTIEFYLVMSFSAQFRQEVRKLMDVFRRCKNYRVTPILSGPRILY